MVDGITFHSILCEFAMLPDSYILPSPREKEVLFFLRGQIYTSGSTFIKKIEPFACHYINLPS